MNIFFESIKPRPCRDSFCRYHISTNVGSLAQYQDIPDENGYCLRNICIYNIPQNKTSSFSPPYMLQL